MKLRHSLMPPIASVTPFTFDGFSGPDTNFSSAPITFRILNMHVSPARVGINCTIRLCSSAQLVGGPLEKSAIACNSIPIGRLMLGIEIAGSSTQMGAVVLKLLSLVHPAHQIGFALSETGLPLIVTVGA